MVLSPHDLRTAAECEFRLVRELDVLLGRAPRVEEPESLMHERIVELGLAHESLELQRLRDDHPGRVRGLNRPDGHSREAYGAAMSETLAALSSDAEVLAQAVIFDGTILGYADFIERTPEGWLVSDTKLARSANVPALLQIAAYAAVLQSHGVPTAPVARLVLGSGERHDYALQEIVPVFHRRWARLKELVADHRADAGPGTWGDARWTACGRCDVCDAEVTAHRDLLLVAGMRTTTRRRFVDAGIQTIDDLATAEGPVEDVQDHRLERLRAQAQLQLRAEAERSVPFDVIDEAAIRRLPRPSAGDIFFDFEGDPLWSERGSSVWGLEYLFGLVEVDTDAPVFQSFWAHDRAQEKQALIDFVDYVEKRRATWPGLHIYHYAPYETAALKRLAARHSVCEDAVDQLLRDGVFVDLYATVRAAIRVGQRSYSIKKLEPLYMGARTADLQKGDDSIVEYHRFMMARTMERWDEATQIIDGIAEYNEDDCISTWKLRDWLIERVPDGIVGAPGEAQQQREVREDRQAQLALEAELRALVDDIPPADRTAEDHAVALVASAVLFHAREDKPFWWEHYDRIAQPVGNWQRSSGVAVVEGEAELLEDWHKPTPRSGAKRRYSVLVNPVGGTLLELGNVTALYAAPPAFPPAKDHQETNAHAKSPSTTEVIEAEEVLGDNGRIRQRLTILENAPGRSEIDVFPLAFVPTGTIPTKSIDEAIREIAEDVRDSHPVLPERSGIDVLLRRGPRLRGGVALPAVGTGDERFVTSIGDALLGMDDSFVAVQGPPGTGKTYVGARVIARLVRDHGWKVGVCSQGHAAIENILTAVVAAGLPADQVAKAPKHTDAPTWTALKHSDDIPAFMADLAGEGKGCVIGGTAWDLTNTKRVERGELDLVVIDEAGQFSLAKTLAVSAAGARLLLLGDPAQLPQVSQGVHPDPVDESALGWLADGESLVPPELGYFLETTWRMHPQLTEAVSQLSYAGQLTSETRVTAGRSLDGVEPGIHVVQVEHRDNRTSSPEEAAAVVGLIRDLLDRTWVATDDDDAQAGRPLSETDFCVITPYNSQMGAIKAALREVNLDAVPVGTVDKFQGQEAPIAILSLAASSHGDVSRGMGFLLDRHRLNVAVSRGKHAAYIVHSTGLADFPPNSASELIALGAFLGLTERAVESTSPAATASAGLRA
ncbi:nuclease [Knoellia subterranea KCTC 19937]|uniref:Nuclease n=1 Tax=Knoellia subterranea KCTC 19937 TaxID=1385521 RepID=A0A0A0JKE8_9MICO|nr:nuclease [Knoellia subterranea KCTC 19937]